MGSAAEFELSTFKNGPTQSSNSENIIVIEIKK